MALNLANPATIKAVIGEIGSSENLERKKVSLEQFEVFMDRMAPYVKAFLKNFYNEQDIDSMPVITSINLCRRIIMQEASVYNTCPKRTFVNVTPEQAIALEEIYEDMNLDAMLQKSNQYYKLQGQNNIQILPIDKKLKVRVLLNHHFDVVPRMDIPEVAEAYILSGFNKLNILPSPSEGSDGVNEYIADANDYLSNKKIYAIWTDEYNYLASENGDVIGGVQPNPLGMMPFVDVSQAKDFEFFVRSGNSVTDFTIQFNASLTDMSQIVRMQGFAQAYMIASETMMPQSIKVGPMIAVKMPVNPNQPEVRPEFGFAQPNADISGSLEFLQSLVSLFLSSRGIDPKTVTGTGTGEKFSSGLERLLSMLDRFEVSRSDFSVYETAEKKIFKIVAKYLNTYAGTDVLKYQISPISDEADVEVEFNKPEMIKTDADKIQMFKDKLDLGLMSTVEAIAEDRGISIDEALKVKSEIDKNMGLEFSDDVAVEIEKPGVDEEIAIEE